MVLFWWKVDGRIGGYGDNGKTIDDIDDDIGDYDIDYDVYSCVY